MKQYIKTNRILLVLLALCVLVSVAVVGQRWRAENRNHTYDIVLDYTELQRMAEQSGHDEAWWLAQFRDMGLTQVALTEESLATLMESNSLPVTATAMDIVLKDADWAENYPAGFIRAVEDYGYDRFDVLVQTVGEEASSFVVDAVRQRFHSEDVVIYEEGGNAYILLNGTVEDALYGDKATLVSSVGKSFTSRTDIAASKLMYVSLGLLAEKVEAIQAQGMEIIPRTLCYNGHNDDQYAKAVIEGYESFGIVPDYIIAGGEAIVGYDDPTGPALEYIEDNGITIGLIETNVQRENIMQTGIEEAVKATGYDAVRVFSMWDYVQNRYAYYGYSGAEEIENTLYRAVVERNIRVLYFKPLKETDDDFIYLTDPDIYRDLFDGLDQRLAEHGISRGRASVLPEIEVPYLALLALGLGAGLGGALLPATCLPMKKKWTLLLAGAAVVCVTAAWWIMPNTYRLLASFASAVVFACLATAFFLKRAKEYGESLPANASLGRILPRSVGVLA